MVLENYMGHKISTMPEKWKHAYDKEETLFMNLSKTYKQFAESRYKLHGICLIKYTKKLCCPQQPVLFLRNKKRSQKQYFLED